MTADHTLELMDGSTIELPDPDVVDDDQGADEPQPATPWDPMAELTLAELDSGSRLLKASIVRAISEQTEHYERALAVVAYLYARRTERTAKLDAFTSLTWLELHDRIEAMRPTVDPEGPTAPGPG